MSGRGARLRLGAAVEGVHCAGGRITGITVAGAGRRETVQADHYVAALPVEQRRLLLSPALRAADPRLARLDSAVPCARPCTQSPAVGSSPPG